ncbi:hypothetical protein [Clostridium massiliamazoniense]|uniref:hypothetical protein n=1 Tax=Clostridium massiliamazoniense TaxID=1347366 RepID=UPI0006D84857|nr:hypothetical protein [Clostridium massiliamazoniense]
MELRITYIKDIIRCFAGKSMFYIELELDYNEDCLFMDYRKFKEHIEEGLLVDSEVFFDEVKLQKYKNFSKNDDNQMIRNQLYESGEVWGLSEIIDLDTNKSRFKLYEEMVEIDLDNFEQKKKEWIKKIEKCKAVEGERRIYEKLNLY